MSTTIPSNRRATLRKARSLAARSRQLGPAAFFLFARAFAHLLTAKLALKTQPVARILARKQRPIAHPTQLTLSRQAALRARIRHAIVVVSRYSPIRFVCFPQCLAAAALLRAHGLESRLHYGITRDAQGRLHTHTWLESGGEIIIGGESAPQFSTLAIY